MLAALGKADFGLYGVVGGMMVIALLAFTMRLLRGRNATLSLSMHTLRGLLIKTRLDSRMLKKRDRNIWSVSVQGENGINWVCS